MIRGNPHTPGLPPLLPTMTPRRTHANGLPWLLWFEDRRWSCEGCGGAGRVPEFTGVPPFAYWLGNLKREHAGCGVPPPDQLADGQVGDPLNGGRVER